MSTGGTFDKQSAVRIARTVIEHERGLPVPTQQRRRPPAAAPAGSLQLVRLLTDVPASSISNSTRASEFYAALAATGISSTAAAEGSAVSSSLSSAAGNVASGGSSLCATEAGAAVATFLNQQNAALDATQAAGNTSAEAFGSGLAVLCTLTVPVDNTEQPGSVFAASGGGQIHTSQLRYGDVVRVYNMHSRGFFASDGAGYNAAGSLGGGFCNAMVGPAGHLWLISRDLRLLALLETTAADHNFTLANLISRVEALEDALL